MIFIPETCRAVSGILKQGPRKISNKYLGERKKQNLRVFQESIIQSSVVIKNENPFFSFKSKDLPIKICHCITDSQCNAIPLL